MMQCDLSGKNIVVTGGFGALGKVVGEFLMAQGAQVALLDIAPMAPTVAAVPEGGPVGLLRPLQIGNVNLQDPASTEAALKQVVASFGGLDGLVNVAGGFRWETIEAGSLETWDLLYGMNTRTALVASKSALPYLLERGSGRIVNVGALAANQAGLGMGAYAASKAGVARFTEALAEELKDKNITVNAVLPSILDTPGNRADMPDADTARWVPLMSLAKVIAFLVSDEASAITGALIPVKGKV